MASPRWWLYRKAMRFLHAHNWHHAPPIGPLMPGGEYQLWCHWCGFRQSMSPQLFALTAVDSNVYHHSPVVLDDLVDIEDQEDNE